MFYASLLSLAGTENKIDSVDAKAYANDLDVFLATVLESQKLVYELSTSRAAFHNWTALLEAETQGISLTELLGAPHRHLLGQQRTLERLRPESEHLIEQFESIRLVDQKRLVCFFVVFNTTFVFNFLKT